MFLTTLSFSLGVANFNPKGDAIIISLSSNEVNKFILLSKKEKFIPNLKQSFKESNSPYSFFNFFLFEIPFQFPPLKQFIISSIINLACFLYGTNINTFG